MNRSILLTTALLISILSISAQDSKGLLKGKKYYEYYDYYNTIEKFEPLSLKTFDIKKDLAYSYFNVGEYAKSEAYFAEITNTDTASVDDLYAYFKVLMINQKYTQASKQMERIKAVAPDDVRSSLFSDDLEIPGKLAEDKGYFTLFHLAFNSEAQDFSPVIRDGQLIFSSSGKSFESWKRRWNWNNLPFLDLYSADYDTSTLELSAFKRFHFNKKYHEGTSTFNKEGNFMYFTSNNYKQTDREGVHRLELYGSAFKNGKWQKPDAFPYNSPEYSIGHPSISEDGSRLYFASDMPGGIGGVDLYVCMKEADGKWSKPVNPGKSINTEGNEMFPFIHPDGYLFFASDGRPGLGGLDVFVSKVRENEFTGVRNIGPPINTNFDDFGFVIDSLMKKGWFSSNRISGKGDDDIYGFSLSTPFFKSLTFRGIVVDSKGNLLKETNVSVYDPSTGQTIQLFSDENGQFTTELDRDSEYKVNGKKEKFHEDETTVNTFGDIDVVETKLILEPFPEYDLIGTVFDSQTGNVIDSVSVSLKDISSGKDYEKLTDASGRFSQKPDGVNPNDEKKYSVIITKKGYLPYKREFSIRYDREGVYNINEYLDIELQKIDIGVDISKALNVNPIYFDLNKYSIRPDAALELDKIVKVMNDYPTLVIELGSHTDSRGSDASNKTLSQRRADASAKYIKERITNPERIYGKGYGESIPNIVNQESHDVFPVLPVGQKLTEKFINSLSQDIKEKAHQLNRRTEFKIIKY